MDIALTLIILHLLTSRLVLVYGWWSDVYLVIGSGIWPGIWSPPPPPLLRRTSDALRSRSEWFPLRPPFHVSAVAESSRQQGTCSFGLLRILMARNQVWLNGFLVHPRERSILCSMPPRTGQFLTNPPPAETQCLASGLSTHDYPSNPRTSPQPSLHCMPSRTTSTMPPSRYRNQPCRQPSGTSTGNLMIKRRSFSSCQFLRMNGVLTYTIAVSRSWTCFYRPIPAQTDW